MAPRSLPAERAGLPAAETVETVGLPAAGRRTGSTWPWLALLAAPAFTVAALLLREPSQSGTRALTLLAAVGAWAAVVVRQWRSPSVGRWTVIAAGAVPLCVAVALAPQGSRDLWGYAAYGRVLVTYHQNPYRHAPSEHAGDPVIDRMPAPWGHTKAPYGPAFLVVAGVPSALGVRSALATRLWFQGIVALVAALGLGVLARSRAGPGQLALFALNPVLAGCIVNGGHNDLLVGVLVLAAVVAAERRLWVPAGVALGLAAAVKVVALLPAVLLAAWAWRRYRQGAFAVLGAAAGVLAVSYAAVGGTAAIGPLGVQAAQQSRASLWEALSTWMLRSPHWFSGGSAAGGGLVHHWAPYALAGAAVAAVAAVAATAEHRHSAATLVSLGLLAYLLAAPYVLPWYAGWFLPLLPLAGRGLVGREGDDRTRRAGSAPPAPAPLLAADRVAVSVGAAYAALLMLVYTDVPGYSGAAHPLLHTLAWLGAPVLEAAALVTVLAAVTASRRRDRKTIRGNAPAAAIPSGTP